jgi:hypothetical protein
LTEDVCTKLLTPTDRTPLSSVSEGSLKGLRPVSNRNIAHPGRAKLCRVPALRPRTACQLSHDVQLPLVRDHELARYFSPSGPRRSNGPRAGWTRSWLETMPIGMSAAQETCPAVEKFPTLCMLGSELGEPPAPSIVANHASTTPPTNRSIACHLPLVFPISVSMYG